MAGTSITTLSVAELVRGGVDVVEVEDLGTELRLRFMAEDSAQELGALVASRTAGPLDLSQSVPC